MRIVNNGVSLCLVVFSTIWNIDYRRVLLNKTQALRSETRPGSMDCLSLGMVQRFAFSETLFYGKTPQVHRHLIYTDPSLRLMEGP